MQHHTTAVVDFEKLCYIEVSLGAVDAHKLTLRQYGHDTPPEMVAGCSGHKRIVPARERYGIGSDLHTEGRWTAARGVVDVGGAGGYWLVGKPRSIELVDGSGHLVVTTLGRV